MSKFEDMPTWLQCLWRENPTLARQAEQHIDMISSRSPKEDKLSQRQAIVISAYTQFLMCDFSALHADIEKTLGRPVFTHEISDLAEAIRSAYKDDFLALCNATELKKV